VLRGLEQHVPHARCRPTHRAVPRTTWTRRSPGQAVRGTRPARRGGGRPSPPLETKAAQTIHRRPHTGSGVPPLRRIPGVAAHSSRSHAREAMTSPPRTPCGGSDGSVERDRTQGLRKNCTSTPSDSRPHEAVLDLEPRDPRDEDPHPTPARARFPEASANCRAGSPFQYTNVMRSTLRCAPADRSSMAGKI
jgi:hypothetical protein